MIFTFCTLMGNTYIAPVKWIFVLLFSAWEAQRWNHFMP